MAQKRKKFHKGKIFAYENSEGDKGIICAMSYEEAVKLFYQKYPKRKIMDPLDRDSDYWENRSYLFAVGTMKSNELYCCFPW